MAKNGLRQIGEPRIGPHANLQRPEPLHLEVNNLGTPFVSSLHRSHTEFQDGDFFMHQVL